MNHYDDIIWLNYSRELKGIPIETLLDTLSDLDPRNRKTIKVILGNCYEAQRIGHDTGELCFVAVSLRKDSFKHRKDYNQKHATYTRVKSSLKYLLEKDLIRVTPGFRDSKTKKGKSTRIGLSMKSGKVLFGGQSSTDKPETPALLIRDSKKNLVHPTKFKSFRRLQNKVIGWNKSLEGHKFSLDEAIYKQIYGICSLLGQKEKKAYIPPDFRRHFGSGDSIRLQRIFNNSSLKKGGRIYTDLQNLKTEMRPEIRIDGARTTESDYQCLHPRMLYNKLGQNPTSNLYESQIWPRNALKSAFSIAINSSSRLQAEAALSRPKKGSKRPVYDGDLLLSWLETEHSGLLPFFYKQVGLELMYQDSCIASLVLDHFLGRNEAILPVHDSFVVKEEFGPELIDVMNWAYVKQVGHECVIKTKAA